MRKRFSTGKTLPVGVPTKALAKVADQWEGGPRQLEHGRIAASSALPWRGNLHPERMQGRQGEVVRGQAHRHELLRARQQTSADCTCVLQAGPIPMCRTDASTEQGSKAKNARAKRKRTREYKEKRREEKGNWVSLPIGLSMC